VFLQLTGHLFIGPKLVFGTKNGFWEIHGDPRHPEKTVLGQLCAIFGIILACSPMNQGANSYRNNSD
jgi:hypothetical protein